MIRFRMVHAAAIAVVMLLVSGRPVGTADRPERRDPPSVGARRYGSVIGLRAEKLEEYKKLHAAVWPKVAEALREAHVRNYSIYLRKLPDGKYYLFSYLEYVGHDFEGDMKRVAANPETRRWWTFTDPCQEPLPDRKPGEWWASMEEVFHQD